MLSFVTGALVAASIANSVNAECANACNGHGKCTAYDMCICNRNWQGNDCNQRVCQFGLAHVDTPKGDLDMSGDITGPNHPIVDNHPVYPYGTTEQFPQMEDTDLRPLSNSGHYYMECSNKGTCSRQTGECQCFDGYDGAACERASCPGFPNSCSGHGTCKTISQLAAADYGNVYKLWDRDSTMGCDCDSGYYGADCSLRDCKHGVDPLYLDDASTAKVGIYDFGVLNTGTEFSDGMSASGANNGEWAIRFFDSFGEDWLTTAIPAWATCTEVVAALEGLPNEAVPASSIECTRTEYTVATGALTWTTTAMVNGHTYNLYYKMAAWNAIVNPELVALPNSWTLSSGAAANTAITPKFTGDIYRIKFTQNPGALREPQIELYLDGKRPSLIGKDDEIVVTFVVTDGQQGEDNDYFADHCDGVTATIDAVTNAGAIHSDYVALGGLDTAEVKLLKACLGDADGDATNNVEVYNWDHGSNEYPHLIKLVRTVTSYNDGGYYAALYWSGSQFKLLNPFVPPDALASDTYDIYTTKGVMKRSATDTKAVFGYGYHHIITTADQQIADNTEAFNGDISCESGHAEVQHCLDTSDLFTILDHHNYMANPPYINLYTAKRIWTTEFEHNVGAAVHGLDLSVHELHRGTNIIETDLAMNWGGDDENHAFRVYKFSPDTTSTYEYVAPCANRGICNTDSGICECFPGYTSDSCAVQDSLSL